MDERTPVTALWPELTTDPIAVRTRNSLKRAGIYCVGHLTANWTADNLMDLWQFGPSQLAEVRRVLAAEGLALKGDAQ
jgi:DNA-directed RNA polymerase alpha subunit